LHETQSKNEKEHPAVVEAARKPLNEKENFNLIVTKPVQPTLTINKEVQAMKSKSASKLLKAHNSHFDKKKKLIKKK